MSKALVECADDRYFIEPVLVAKNKYKRMRNGCRLVIILEEKPPKRYLRVNAPVDCLVGWREADMENRRRMLDEMILLKKKDADGRHEFLDFGPGKGKNDNDNKNI